VLTSLGRESIPMLRHWTSDLVVRRPASDCGCGRTWDYYEGGLLGRADDVRKIRGCLVTPGMIEDVVRSFAEIDEFRTVIDTVDALDTLLITVEPRAGQALGADLTARVEDAIKRAAGVRPVVRPVAPGTLPRFEMKASRFHDARQAYALPG
jgi:phenylacetate-CoA ligase